MQHGLIITAQEAQRVISTMCRNQKVRYFTPTGDESFLSVFNLSMCFFSLTFFYIYEMELSKKGRDGVTKDRSSA